VYVPRPQTEALATRARAVLPATVGGGRGRDRVRAVDLCCGCGAVAASLPGAVGLDLDPAAARLALRNGVPAVVADVGAVPLRAGAFDVVTAVAPYVPTDHLAFLPADVRDHEPRAALDGGPDGLAVVRAVVATAHRLLRPGGWLLVEVGAGQEAALDDDGFEPAEPWYDEDGDLRGLAARRRAAGAVATGRSSRPGRR
jgi:release factor glutamine methyltransferase